MYSILIITKNEEANIGKCIESLYSDDIVVLDSYSSDKTVEIANEYSVKVLFRVFDNYAAQRNYGLNLDFIYPWVFVLDADERMTPELHEEILDKINGVNEGIDMYRVRRKDMFMGRWLKRSSGYPTWLAGLIRVGNVTVQREINEEFICNGEEAHLMHHTIHYPFNKGLNYWLERHLKYSDMESVLLLKEVKLKIKIRDSISTNPTVRRRALKQIAYRMPFRPLLVFVYLYIFRAGFMDGYPGLAFCTLRSYYEFLINLKVKLYKINNN